METLKDTAIAMFEAAVARADPARALRAQLEAAPLQPLPAGGREVLLAVGKAAVPMLREALRLRPGAAAALAITNPENYTEIPGATVLCGAHPVPDETSAAAGRAAIDLAQSLGPRDRLVALISGGGSALMVAPAPGLTLADKAAVNQLLLASGLEINDMNLVRQQLSDVKGGGLLRHAAPAQVQAYILSDVIGDDLRAIASGPTVAPIGTRSEAREILQRAGVWERLPEAVQRHLSASGAAQATTPQATNSLIGSNRHSLKAMIAAAPEWQPRLITHRLTGDVAAAAETVVAAAEAAPRDRPVALVFGGETTVQLKGTGLGGRNQELALRVAKLGAGRLTGDWLFLSGGTDGRDGPTDAAGGVVGAATWAAIRAAGQDPEALLANNDSHAALNAADALLMTGGTGTNVADVQVFLRRPG
ncbi:glycerate kinase type-2 family protein [Cribrihabitans neustonicus]|uniref:glycerate kinase type-2 family protein n=1 Tax=Cribrihabitans neustonicus TaxID=1429085 RepID=UPI003B5ABDA7